MLKTDLGLVYHSHSHTVPKGYFIKNHLLEESCLSPHFNPWRHFSSAQMCMLYVRWRGLGHNACPYDTCSLPAKALLALRFPWFICAVQKLWPEMCPKSMGACTSLSTRQSSKGEPEKPCGIFSFDFCIFPLHYKGLSALYSWLVGPLTEYQCCLCTSPYFSVLYCVLALSVYFLSVQLFLSLNAICLFFSMTAKLVFWCTSILLHQSLEEDVDTVRFF